MNDVESSAWTSFKSVIQSFLRDRKTNNCRQLVDELIQTYRGLGINMSIKIHFLLSHLDNTSENCGCISDEQGKKLNQGIKLMEERYLGSWDKRMMADYCWNLKMDNPYQQNSRKSRKRIFRNNLHVLY